MNDDKLSVNAKPIKKQTMRRGPTHERFRPTPEEATPVRSKKRIPRPQPVETPDAPPETSPSSSEAVSVGGVSAQTTSPKPTRSFLSVPAKDNADFSFTQPPDTMGAVGTQDLIAFTNRLVYAQARNGDGEGFIDLDVFWEDVDADVDAFDPRIVWDHNSSKFICCSVANAHSKNSSLLMGVTTGPKAGGDWMIAELPVSDPDFEGNDLYWADYPMLGFSQDKIVVSCNMFLINGNMFDHTALWIFDRAVYTDDYGLTGHFLKVSSTFTCFPARTLDATADLFLAQTGTPNTVKIYAVKGPADNPVFTAIGNVTTPSQWSAPPTNANAFLPQKDTGDKLDAGDTRALSVLVRDGSLYLAHNVFLPAGGTPTRCSVMWWQISIGSTVPAVIQNGIYDDPGGKQFYAYPSIAANWKGDALVGFSTFAKDQYPNAAYALHAASDPFGQLRMLYTYQKGDGYYNAANSDTDEYRWGDYSSTVVDPANDEGFWTIQEYALDEPIAAYYHTWSTYWACVVPPASLGDKYLAWTGTDDQLNIATGLEVKTTLPETSKDGPSLCAFKDLLYIGWTGTSSDHSVNLRSSIDGVTFGPRNKLDEESTSRPALCVFKPKASYDEYLFLAWTGTSSTHSVNLRVSLDGVTFGVRNKLDEQSSAGPALCVFNNRLYIAWRGTSEGRINIMSSEDGVNFNQKVTLNETCTGGPALAVFRGKLYVAWTGTSSTQSLDLCSSSDGLTFGSRVKLDDVSIAGPSLLATDDLLYIAWTGKDSRHSLDVKASPDGVNFLYEQQLIQTSNYGPYLASFYPV